MLELLTSKKREIVLLIIFVSVIFGILNSLIKIDGSKKASSLKISDEKARDYIPSKNTKCSDYRALYYAFQSGKNLEIHKYDLETTEENKIVSIEVIDPLVVGAYGRDKTTNTIQYDPDQQAFYIITTGHCQGTCAVDCQNSDGTCNTRIKRYKDGVGINDVYQATPNEIIYDWQVKGNQLFMISQDAISSGDVNQLKYIDVDTGKEHLLAQSQVLDVDGSFIVEENKIFQLIKNKEDQTVNQVFVDIASNDLTGTKVLDYSESGLISYDIATSLMKENNLLTYYSGSFKKRSLNMINLETKEHYTILEKANPLKTLLYWSGDGQKIIFYPGMGLSYIDLNTNKVRLIDKDADFILASTPSCNLLAYNTKKENLIRVFNMETNKIVANIPLTKIDHISKLKGFGWLN